MAVSDPLTCAMCPKMCRFACPVARAEHSDAFHPTGLATAVVGARRGTLPWPVAGRVVYGCTMCFACHTYCALGQDVPSYIREARNEAVQRGAAPETILELGRTAPWPHGVDVSAVVGDAVKEAMQTDAGGETDVVYVPSCTALAHEPRIVISVISVLQAAGVGVRVVHPGCCGAVYADAGHADVAERLGAEMRDAVGRARGGYVVTDSPECARTLGATPFAVVAAQLVASGALRPRRVQARVAYHDPCVLGRHLGIYDEPRAVVESVVGELAPLAHERERSRCSGGGAALPWAMPEASRAIAAERAEEVRVSGADMVVTACARCKMQLGAVGLAVRDLAEVLASSL